MKPFDLVCGQALDAVFWVMKMPFFRAALVRKLRPNCIDVLKSSKNKFQRIEQLKNRYWVASKADILFLPLLC